MKNCQLAPLRYTFAIALALNAMSTETVPLAASETGTTAMWFEGEALIRRLSEPIDLVWSNQSIRDGLRRFSQIQRTAIILDRRIDPDHPVTIRVRQVAVGEVLRQIARQVSGEMVVVGNVAYIGPASITSKLRTLAAIRADEATKLGEALRTKVLQRKTMSWPDLAQPRDLLAQLAAEVGIKVAEPLTVPHDLWAGAVLPTMMWTDRLSVILAQFDLTYSIQGDSIRWIPIPAQVQLVRSYPGGKQPNVTAHRFAAAAPKAQVRVVGDKVVVAGTLEDHEVLSGKTAEAPAQRSQHDDSLVHQRFDLKVSEQPLGALMRALCTHLQIELKLDEEAIKNRGIDLDQRVSFEVKQASIDELFDTILKPMGLKAERNGMRVEVRPR